MMGTKERHFAPLIHVSLEELVPQDHFYRHLERTLDLSFVYEFVHKTYAGGGRPSIDPVVFFKLQLVMFFEDIRSERLLMRHVADRLSVRWYLGYDLNEPLPDHSSLTKIRTRYGLEVFRRFFEKIVEQCQQAGLVWGRELYIDSTSPEQRAELSQQNAERHDWIEQLGAQDRRVNSRGYQRMADYLVSTTDPDATLMETTKGADMGYRTHYAVDGGKARVILGVLVTPSEVMDNQPMRDLIFRTRFRWKLWPRQVTGDTKYGTTDNIVAMERERIHAYVPIADLTQRTPYFRQEDFQYDAERDVYLCPTGKELRLDRPHSTERSLRYRARARECNHCPLKAQCTTSNQGRTLCRSVEEEYLGRVRGYHETEDYKKAYRKRSVWLEPLFAEGKDWHGMRRFRLRLLWRVNCEALTRAAGQNLKRLLKQRGWGRRPFPAEAVSALFLASCTWVTRLFWGIGLFPRRWSLDYLMRT